MSTLDMKKPRPVLTHRRGLIPTRKEGTRIVSQPTALLNPPGNPDDDFGGIVANLGLVKHPHCSAWCFGHHPDDDDPGPCTPAFYDWVEAGDDTVVVTASQHVGEQPRVCLFPGDSDERGGRYPADKARAIAALILKSADLIDPPLAA